MATIKQKHHYIRTSIIILVALIILGTLSGLYYKDHHKTTKVIYVSANQYTKGEPTQTQSSSSANNSSSSQQSTKSINTSTSNQTLVAPSGDFVSDHHPNLSGSPAPNSMTSVCNTTPGATCQITFTMGNTVKSLPTQTTDSGGTTYWNWTLQQIGLTQGTWTIKATSSLNSNSLSASDVMNLVVSP